MSPHPAPLPTGFAQKKQRILDILHPPETPYTDKSPKGSVDAQILDLIDEINAHAGLVTTSSCAGRASVFLEGSHGEEGGGVVLGERGGVGGKGSGGRWLFVSHDPLPLPLMGRRWTEVFGLARSSGSAPLATSTQQQQQQQPPRLVRFAFEPLILHVLCASLKHAQPLLAAAINAGFRESGVQSLKTVDEKKEGEGGGVMVAVRTAGLGLESLVGVLRGLEGEIEGACEAIVGEEYLGLLVTVANARFVANDERRERFRRELKKHMERFEREVAGTGWEDKEERAMRKKAEGLHKRQEMQMRRDREGIRQGSTDSTKEQEREELVFLDHDPIP